MPPAKPESVKGASTAYVFIFLLALATWFFLRKQENYQKWVEHARAQDWITLEGLNHRKTMLLEAAGGESSNDDGSSTLDSEASGSGGAMASSSGGKETNEEGAVAPEKGDDDDASDATDTGPQIDDMERAREELAILERAVASRSEENRLYIELIRTKNVQAQLHDPPPPGPADELFMNNLNEEIIILTKKWIDDFAQVRAIQKSPESFPEADENMKKLADWQERWEKRELERLLQESKEKIGFTTLTGRKAAQTSTTSLPVDGERRTGKVSGDAISHGIVQGREPVAEGEPAGSQSSRTGEELSQEGGSHMTTTAVSGDSGDFGLDAPVALRIMVPQITSTGNPLTEGDKDDLLATLKSLETNAMQWTESSKKQVVVLGERVYISRDMGVYKWAFTRLGFNIRLGASSTGRMSTKLLASGDWSVLLCLALNTEHCFTSTNLDRTKRYQRVNRVQGLRRVLWSKDSFCETVSSSARGSALFGKYIFDCWIFPREYAQAASYAQAHPKSQFIVKPLSMGGGMGISVVDGEKGLHKVRRQTHIVQNYLHNPMLIKGKKWDLRTYVLVTSVLPLRGYVYNRGLVRFASQAYDPTAKHGGKRTQFLTNTSVNKHYVKKGNVTDITWAFDDLRKNLDAIAPGTYNKLLGRMQAAISIVMLSAERSWRKYFDSLGGEMCGNCYQLMGVDLIVDADLQPRVIEVNGQPSMQLTKSEEDHYTTTKKNMIRDLTAMVYNEDRVAGDLMRELSTFDREIVTQLQTRDHEYLLEYYREKQAMGGWLSVYPSHRHYKLHEEFFRYQKNPPTEEARMTLHHILGALDQRFVDMGGPKPREQRASNQSDDDDEGPVIDDEGIIEEEGEVEEESNEATGDDR